MSALELEDELINASVLETLTTLLIDTPPGASDGVLLGDDAITDLVGKAVRILERPAGRLTSSDTVRAVVYLERLPPTLTRANVSHHVPGPAEGPTSCASLCVRSPVTHTVLRDPSSQATGPAHPGSGDRRQAPTCQTSCRRRSLCVVLRKVDLRLHNHIVPELGPCACVYAVPRVWSCAGEAPYVSHLARTMSLGSRHHSPLT